MHYRVKTTKNRKKSITKIFNQELDLACKGEKLLQKIVISAQNKIKIKIKKFGGITLKAEK